MVDEQGAGEGGPSAVASIPFTSGKENRRVAKLQRKLRELQKSSLLLEEICVEARRMQHVYEVVEDSGAESDVDLLDEEADSLLELEELVRFRRRRKPRWRESRTDNLKYFSKKHRDIEKVGEVIPEEVRVTFDETREESNKGKYVEICQVRRALKRDVQIREHCKLQKENVEKRLKKNNLKRPGLPTARNNKDSLDGYILKATDKNARKISKKKGKKFTNYLVSLQHRELGPEDYEQLKKLDPKEKDLEVKKKESIHFEEELENFLISLQFRDITPEDYEHLLRLEENVGPKTAPKSKIDQLLREKYDPIKHGLVELCNICMEEFVLEHVVTKLKCNHYFHSACIRNWLENCSTTCPLDGLEAC